MDNGFKKFKRKIRAGAVLRSVLAGFSLGLIAVAALWLVAKLTAADPDFMRFGLIGGGVALVSFVIFLIFQLPTDRRLAKRLDNKLELHEKVQTMIAFRGDNSEMVQLQREDTQRILMQTPGKKARSKSAWLVTILPVLACICLAVTFIVPAKGVEPPPAPVETWLMTDVTEQSLKDLIKYVESSGMQNVPKGQIVSELQSLLSKLKTVTKKTDMQQTVVSSITKIHAYALPCHIHVNSVKALKSSTNDVLVKLGSGINGMNYGLLTTAVQTEMFAALKVENKQEVAGTLAGGIELAVDHSKEAADHPLAAALLQTAQMLRTVTDDMTEEAVKELLSDIDQDVLALALKQPIIDVTVEQYTINQLMYIFSIPQTMIPQEILDSFETGTIDGETSDGKDDEDHPTTGSGGRGDGEFEVGSDDMIFDPNSGELGQKVVYGQVIRDYSPVFDELMREGDVPEDLAEMANKYISILFKKQED